MQERCNSTANALQLLLFYTDPSICCHSQLEFGNQVQPLLFIQYRLVPLKYIQNNSTLHQSKQCWVLKINQTYKRYTMSLLQRWTMVCLSFFILGENFYAMMKPTSNMEPSCCLNSSPPGQNGHHFADNIFRLFSMNERSYILIKTNEPMLTPFINAYMRH